MSDPRELINRQAVLDAIVQPPFEELRERARERRRRRSSFLGLALVLAVTGFGVPVLTSNPVEKPAPDARRAMSVVDGYFLDTRHGVTLYAAPAPSDKEKCRAAVRLTADGGRSWSRPRPAPCRSNSLDEIRMLHISMLDAYTLLLGGIGSSDFSRDAGQTWTTHRIELEEHDSIPAHTKIWRKCTDPTDCRVPNQLHWYDPAAGNVVQLRTPPAVRRLTCEPVWARDRSLWVSGLTQANEFVVAVSRDFGRTWRLAKLGLKREHAGYNMLSVATQDGETGYAVYARKGRSALFRTTDGGGTWQRLHPNIDLADPFTLRDPYVSTDGTLLLTIPQAPQQWYRSIDQGRTFTPQHQLSAIRWVDVVADGYVGRDGSGAIYLSEDGLHWREVRLP